jgi:hypothetical protein
MFIERRGATTTPFGSRRFPVWGWSGRFGIDAQGTGVRGHQGAGGTMIPLPTEVRVWIAAGHTDLQQGMQGPARQVQPGPSIVLTRQDTGEIDSDPPMLSLRPPLAALPRLHHHGRCTREECRGSHRKECTGIRNRRRVRPARSDRENTQRHVTPHCERNRRKRKIETGRLSCAGVLLSITLGRKCATS